MLAKLQLITKENFVFIQLVGSGYLSWYGL